MERSDQVRDALLAFYEGVSTGAVERFDELVADHAAALAIGTAPGEWHTERERLRYGFEAEGLSIEPGPDPVAWAEGSLGWAADEPVFRFPGGAGAMKTRATAVLSHQGGRWRIVHLHVSVGVPDEEVLDLQRRWGTAP